MSDRSLRSLALLLVAGAGVLAATPAQACHLATGWCCVESSVREGDYFCCEFVDDDLQEESCGYVGEQ